LGPREVAHEDPIGNEVFIQRRFAEAFERLNRRKDDWATAEVIAKDIGHGKPSSALVAKVYRDMKDRPSTIGRSKARSGGKGKRKGGNGGPRRPRLEELDAERREAERERVARLQKGSVRKKLMK
jgi:hypothetical protein